MALRNNAIRKLSNGRHFKTVKYFIFFFADKQGLMTPINGAILCKNAGERILRGGGGGVSTYPLLGHKREDFSLGHLKVLTKSFISMSIYFEYKSMIPMGTVVNQAHAR